MLNNDFWNKSPLGKIQAEQTQYLKDYEKHYLSISHDLIENMDSFAIFGCGNGREIEGIVNIMKPKIIFAYDFSDQLLDNCRKAFPDSYLHDTKIKIQQQDFSDNAWELPKLDMAYISNNTLAYVLPVSAQITFLKKIYNKLEPGGLLLVEVPSIYNHSVKRNIYMIINGILNTFIFRKPWGIKSINSGNYISSYLSYSKSDVQQTISNIGFSIVLCETKEIFRKRKERHNTIICLARKT